MPGTCLVVGVGSHHGQDQVGWQVVERLSHYVDESVDTRCARSPEDLLDWLDGVTDLHVVDACAAGPVMGAIGVWRWPHLPSQLSSDRFSTHGTDVRSMLLLAQTLRMLPPKVSIWGINIRASTTDSGTQAVSDNKIDRLAQRLAQQLTILELHGFSSDNSA